MAKRYNSLFVDISGRRGTKKSWLGYISIHFYGLTILILFLFGTLGRVYMDRQTAKLGRQWQKKHEFLNVLKKETENMRLEREKYMNGNHIKVAAKRLGLQETDPAQVHVMRNKHSINGEDPYIIALPQGNADVSNASIN